MARAITPAAIRALNVEVNTTIQDAQAATRLYWNQVAILQNISTGKGLYAAMDDVEPLRPRQKTGEFASQVASSYVYELSSEDLGTILKISKNEITDDKVGIYMARAQKLGKQIAKAPDYAIFDLLKAGEATTLNGQSIAWIDDKAFFATDHFYTNKTSQTYSNLLASSALSDTTFNTAVQRLMEMKDINNRPLGLQPGYLMVPPALRQTALEIINAGLVGNGKTNVNQNLVEVVVNPYLVGADAEWYLYSKEAGSAPLVWQVTDPFEITEKLDPKDDNVAYLKEYHWIAQGRVTAGWGDPRTIIKGKAAA